MGINRPADDSIILTKTKVYSRYFTRHDIGDCAAVLTPMPQVSLAKVLEGYTSEAESLTHLLGELMRLMVQTRPDLAYWIS